METTGRAQALQQLSAGHPSGWLSQPLTDRGQHTHCQARQATLGDQAAVCVDRHMWRIGVWIGGGGLDVQMGVCVFSDVCCLRQLVAL